MPNPASLATLLAILDTYEGMASLYDGKTEYPAHIFDRIDDLKSEIASLAELALGRIFAMGSRPSQPGDLAEYARCRAIVIAGGSR